MLRSAVRTPGLRAGGALPYLPPGAALAGTVMTALAALALTGQLVSAGVFDVGPLVRIGLPAARAVHDLAAAATVGLLVIGVWCVAPEPGTEKQDGDRLDGVRAFAVRLAAGSALIWLAAALVVVSLTAADVSGLPVGEPGFSNVVMSFVSQVELGQALGVSALLVSTVAAISLSATRVATAGWAAALALVALLPLALAGHAATSAHHMNAVDSLALHLIGVCVWVGGLLAVVALAGRLGERLPAVTARFSTLALACFVLVALSGVINALLRIPSLDDLRSAYGVLLLAKAVLLILLGIAGAVHRRTTVAQLSARPLLFWRLAAAEVVLMGVTMGLGVALSRTPPPAAQVIVDPVSSLLGFPEPPPLTWDRYFTSFYPELLWLVIAVVAAAGYVAGVVRLARRRDRWPWVRTLAWLAGCALLVFVTSGGPGVYGRIHFSTHMLQHMMLMVLVPLLFVLGAPVTLALRTLRGRRDGSFGPRETLLRLVHCAPLRLLGHPLVAAGLFTGGLVVFYYTALFDLALFTHAGHVLMTAHFLGVGYLLVWALVGVDPGPARPGYPFLLLILFVTLAFHAFFGISMMSSQELLAVDWWHAIGQTDDAALLADQQAGGAIAWAAGDLPSLLLAVALVVAWVRDDTRRARQYDRKADRDGDAELRAHNERLAALAKMDERR